MVTPLRASIVTVKGVCSARLVLRGHQLQAELLAALGAERQADPAARLLGHEVDRLGRHELRGHHEVALVLAVLVVADDDHPPRADLLDRLLDRGEEGWSSFDACHAWACSSRCGGRRRGGGRGGLRVRPPRLARALYMLGEDVDLQVNRPPDRGPAERGALAASPGSARPRSRRSRSALTVRLTPSIAIEPFSHHVGQQRGVGARSPRPGRSPPRAPPRRSRHRRRAPARCDPRGARRRAARAPG